ncbi:hypothetical protein [Nocardia sp. NPDC058633]|uniref:hypothetical protein n=1 Tax=Nocardia sp. NPDC058633 TaxID=3346568 RepID=UPI003653CEB7
MDPLLTTISAHTMVLRLFSAEKAVELPARKTPTACAVIPERTNPTKIQHGPATCHRPTSKEQSPETVAHTTALQRGGPATYPSRHLEVAIVALDLTPLDDVSFLDSTHREPMTIDARAAPGEALDGSTEPAVRPDHKQMKSWNLDADIPTAHEGWLK